MNIASSPESCTGETWQRFIRSLSIQRVGARAWPWYVRRVEECLRSVPGRRAESFTREELKRYLDELGRVASIKDWQYSQAVDALRLFFCGAVRAQWCPEVDWGHWRDVGRRLPADHATIAREAPVAPARTGGRSAGATWTGFAGSIRR